MLNDQQLMALLNLRSPLIDYVDVSKHKSGNVHTTVSAAVDVEPKEVFALVKSIVPEFKEGVDVFFYARDDGMPFATYESAGVLVHLKKEKAPAEAEENTHLDSSTLAEMSASVEREA